MTPRAAQRDPKGTQRVPKVDFWVHLSAPWVHPGPSEDHKVPFRQDLWWFGGGIGGVF